LGRFDVVNIYILQILKYFSRYLKKVKKSSTTSQNELRAPPVEKHWTMTHLGLTGQYFKSYRLVKFTLNIGNGIKIAILGHIFSAKHFLG
jgi:hypothetical protein